MTPGSMTVVRLKGPGLIEVMDEPRPSSVQPVKSCSPVPTGRHQPTTGGPISEISISKRSGSAEGMDVASPRNAFVASWDPPQSFGCNTSRP